MTTETIHPLPINFPELGLPVGPYSHAVMHNGLMYTSGLTAYGADAQYGSISEQAEAIFHQLQLIGEQQRTSLDRLIKVTMFVSDLSEMPALRETLFTIYGDHIPASSLVKVDALFADELKIEVEAIIAL